MQTLYFDHNATAPLADAAREAWLDAHQRFWHNPSAPYRPASRARACLEEARSTLAGWMELEDCQRLIFLSGATEGNNAVIAHYARRADAATATILTSPIEHSSVLEAIKLHWSGEVEYLPVDATGRVKLHALQERLNSGQAKPTLVSLMAANNETGVLQPWTECAALCRQLGIPFHCDASQWLGRLPLNDFGNCDWVTASAHKCGGPRGVGLLIRAASANDLAVIAGGGQENGHRGGTEDLPGIMAWLAAMRTTPSADERKRIAADRDRFEQTIQASIANARCLGASANRLWNTSAVVMPSGQQEQWLDALERKGILASSGSACAGHTVGASASHVPLSMGLSAAEARRMLRFSCGAKTTSADWQHAADALVEIYKTRQQVAAKAESNDGLTRIIQIPD